jgi:hypothetical protein
LDTGFVAGIRIGGRADAHTVLAKERAFGQISIHKSLIGRPAVG